MRSDVSWHAWRQVSRNVRCVLKDALDNTDMLCKVRRIPFIVLFGLKIG